MTKSPVMLLILDGWGYREEITPDNAIAHGNTPNWDSILKEFPSCLIETSGLKVGLPVGQMGNSEVGHMNIGAGRVVMQELPKIDEAIRSKEIEKSKIIVEMIEMLKKNGKTCHLMGLMGSGGVHSHQSHIVALCKILNRNNIKVLVHAFLDGRDTPPDSAKKFVEDFENEIALMKNVKISTVSGRFYAMDRDKRWDRVEIATNAISLAIGEKQSSAIEGIQSSYDKGINDEFVVPFIVGEYAGFEDGDAIFMANFRSDRAREITYALADEKFTEFQRKKFFKLSMAVGMTEYSVDHHRFLKTVFEQKALENIYGEIISNHGMTQLRIAETEKYAHVTFFFNGGEEATFKGEERILVPSPNVSTYDLKPEMSVYEVTEKLVKAIESKKFDTIICNFANGDMVGHTGIMEAVLKAVEAVDICVGKVISAIKKVEGRIIITADHGNAEKLIDKNTGGVYTAHTVGKVQAVLVGDKSIKGLRNGKLADLAPTMLELLGIKQPKEMTGKSLIIK